MINFQMWWMNSVQHMNQIKNKVTMRRHIGRRYKNIQRWDDFCFCLSCNSIHTRLNCQFLKGLKCIGSQVTHKIRTQKVQLINARWICMHLDPTLNSQTLQIYLIITYWSVKKRVPLLIDVLNYVWQLKIMSNI